MEQHTTSSPNRRTRKEILHLLKEFSEGSVVVNEFCELHKIHPATFRKWQHRYSKKSDAADNTPGFAALQVVPVVSGLFAEVRGIKIYQPVAASYLKELLS